MIVKQVSVFIENKPGRLNDVADILGANGIDISALSLADTDEYGVVRMILSDPERAKEVLCEGGLVAKVTETLAVAIDDVPGGFSRALHNLTDGGIEIKYMYACISRIDGKALMIISVDDLAAAEKRLGSVSSGSISPSEIYRI